MKSIFAPLALFALTASFALAQTAPSQPQDPTAQAPASPAQGSTTTPSTFPTPKAQEPGTPASTGTTAPSRVGKLKQFTGTVVKESDGYVLKVGSLAYRLDNQDKAQEFDGRNVKISGSLDKQSNTIHVESVEASPAL